MSLQMLRSTHAHSIRWTLSRLWHSMLGRCHPWTEVPRLWSSRCLIMSLQVRNSTPGGYRGKNFWLHSWTWTKMCRWSRSCLWAPLQQAAAEVTLQRWDMQSTAQPEGHPGVHSTAEQSTAEPEGHARCAAQQSSSLCLLMQPAMWIISSST